MGRVEMCPPSFLVSTGQKVYQLESERCHCSCCENLKGLDFGSKLTVLLNNLKLLVQVHSSCWGPVVILHRFYSLCRRICMQQSKGETSTMNGGQPVSHSFLASSTAEDKRPFHRTV